MNDLKFTSCGDYMKGEIFLTSDTHYCHENILKFSDGEGNRFRGDLFSSVEEMNECMLDGWNDTIRESDTVYHLGDFALGNYQKNHKFIKQFRSLPGKKYLIVGNHDDISWCVKSELFKDITADKRIRNLNFILTHFPIDSSGLISYRTGEALINIHGHIHQNYSPTEQHRCVCVEWTDYKPISVHKVLELNNYITYNPQENFYV